MGLKGGTAEEMLKAIEEGNGRLPLHPLIIPRMSIPVDQRNGKPLVTSAMKAECIGEFFFDREAVCPECFDAEDPDPDCSLCGGKVEFMEKITVPWTTCKEIYKAMAVEAANG